MRIPFLLVALVATACGILALPTIQDIPTTSVDISVPKPDSPTSPVTVTVQRIDELIDDETGNLLAARIVDVGFAFDVDTASNHVLVNNVPVALGVSKIKVETTITANAAVADVLPPELIDMAFDIGLAVVDVTATEERMMLMRGDLVSDVDSVVPNGHAMPDVLDVRRITVRVKVTEINGVKVEQMDLVEQVMDVLAEGWILRGTPKAYPASSDPVAMAAMEARREAHRRHCMNHHRRFGALWNKLPRATRVAVAAFFGSLLLLVFFVALPLAAYVHWKERREGYQVVAMSERLPTIMEEDEEGEEKVDEKAWLRANEDTQ